MSAINITAHLAEDAQSRRSRDGEYLLMLRLVLPAHGAGKPIEARATKRYGCGVAADLASKARAREMRRGVRVVLSSAGLSWARGVADLGDVDHLATPDLTYPDRGLDR